MTTQTKSFSIYDRFYESSSIINISSYFNDYKELLKQSIFCKNNGRENKSLFMKAIGMDVGNEGYNLLSDFCSIDNLKVDGELFKVSQVSYDWYKDLDKSSIVNDVKLQTVNSAKQRNLLAANQRRLKYRSQKHITYASSSADTQGHILIPEDDIIVYVRVYTPFSSKHSHNLKISGKLSLDCVIAMHGAQTLDKLRDRITCTSDHAIMKEISETPIKCKTDNAKDIYKSGFFFIDDTFYNDCRYSENKDNSEVIREWLKTQNLGSYNVAKMEETRIDSLVLRFGYPWVYQHQGDCEHLISFSDARFVSPSDELNANCYPRIVRIKSRFHRYCMTCGIYSAGWIVKNSNRVPHDPCLFCDYCFKSYNYIRGKKIGNFKAYRYPYDSDLIRSEFTSKTKPVFLSPKKKPKIEKFI